MSLRFSFKQLSQYLCVFFFLLFKYVDIWGVENALLKYGALSVAVILAIACFSATKFSLKPTLTFILLLSVALVTVVTGEPDLIIVLIMAFAFYESRGDKKLIQCFVYCASVLYFLTVLLWATGVVDGVETLRLVNGVVTKRNSIGFEHVNSVFKNYMPIFFGLYILHFGDRKTRRMTSLIISFAIATLIFAFSNSRNGYFIISLFTLMVLFFEKPLIGVLKKLAPFSFIIFTILSFLIAFVFADKNGFLNVLLTNRPFLWSNLISSVGVSFTGFRNYGVDNTYLWLLYYFGVLDFVVYGCITVIGELRMSKQVEYVLPIVFMALFSMMENTDVFSYNILFIVCMFNVILKITTKEFEYGKIVLQ